MKRSLEAVKMRWYTVPWPEDAPSVVVVDEDLEVLEDALRGVHWEGTYLSYRYEGQVLELRPPAGVDEESDLPLEDHVRVRPLGGGWEMIGHGEASRYEAKRPHIEESEYETLQEDDLEAILEAAGISTDTDSEQA